MYEFLHDARLAQRPKSKSLKLFLLSISHQNDIPKLYFTFLNANQFREKIFLLVWCHSSEIEIYALWNCLAKCFQICHIFLNKKTQIVFFFYLEQLCPGLCRLIIPVTYSKLIQWKTKKKNVLSFLIPKVWRFEVFC